MFSAFVTFSFLDFSNILSGFIFEIKTFARKQESTVTFSSKITNKPKQSFQDHIEVINLSLFQKVSAIQWQILKHSM